MLRSAVSRTTLKAVGQGGLGGSSSHAEGMHPNLGLHSAAATGNIGLVKFALENGQPANSNLNGILPLHAACSGGSEQSVRMLILHGADVNAARLKAKGSTGGPGAEGSTPLHFAAANGHLDIIRILLEAGARPAAADKEGVTPEALALGAGHTECANLIRSWISAYGSNGLAGMVESRETVSGDVTLGPAGYIRYAASGRSASPFSSVTPTATSIANTPPALQGTPPPPAQPSATKSAASPYSSLLASQSSVDALPPSHTAAASKGASLSKTSSNPNLRYQASTAAAMSSVPIASPTSLSMSQSRSQSSSASTFAAPNATASATSPRLAAFPSTQPSHDSLTPTTSASKSTSVGPPSSGAVAAALGSGSIRESKRRPSLPSILEKAAHPAASLRAALASGSSAQTGSSSSSQTSSSRHLDHSYDATTSTLSPGKKHGKLAGKRSLSNMLRKATNAGSTGSQQSSFPSSNTSNSLFGDVSSTSSASLHSTGAINMDALAKPGRTVSKAFDSHRPSAASSLHGPRGNAASEDSAARKHSTPATPSLLTSRSHAPGPEQQRTLRSASSSSSLSAAREQIAGSSHLPVRANASLDLLRPVSSFGQTDDPTAATRSGDKYRAATNQSSRIDAIMRAGTGLGSASVSMLNGQQAESASAAHRPVGRDRSVSGSSSHSAGTTDNERSHAHSALVETADEDDLQEFLHHSASQPDDLMMDGGEQHDSHRLPPGLRTMTAIRQQNNKDVGDPLATASAASQSVLHACGASSDGSTRNNSATLVHRITRDRSGSHVSAVSSGSQSGSSSRGGLEPGPRSSPGLATTYQALSIADEHGLTSPSGPASLGGGLSASLTRTGRDASVAESVTSHASSSSLRSNYLSAAEQAQAILNHEAPYTSDGPDGTSTSLAAQLAAYGEALAMERKRAGDVRSGPSPSLSARGSNAALRSKLPSVSEDQSPSRSASHSSRSFSVSERIPNYPATAAQSYNRRVSRRPHSSEGRESQEGGPKRGTFSSATMTVGSSTLTAFDKARVRLDRSPALDSRGQAQSQAHETVAASHNLQALQQSRPTSDRERAASPHTTGARRPVAPLNSHSRQTSAEAVMGSVATTDPGEQNGPTVPPKDQRRRRHEPVQFSSTTGLPLGMVVPSVQASNATRTEDIDEDDPKTPVLSGNKATLDKFATSPHSLHHHSPSLPTELSSYTTSRLGRLPDPSLINGSNSSNGNSLASLAAPMPPPRKESIHSPALDLDDNRTLNPDSATMMSSGSAGDGMAGRADEASQDKGVGTTTSSSRWEGLRRPSLNMLRSATSSSTHSQTPSHTSIGGSTEEYGHSRWSTEDSVSKDKPDQLTASGSGKRRLVRTLLNKAKGSS